MIQANNNHGQHRDPVDRSNGLGHALEIVFCCGYCGQRNNGLADGYGPLIECG